MRMRDLSCDIIEDLLPLYIEHVETEDTRAVVEAHLAGCPVCREKAAQMGRPVPVSVEVDTGILQKTRQRIRKKNGEVLGVTAVMVAACELSDHPLQGIVYADVPKDSLPDGLAAEVEEDRVEISREYQGIANNYGYKEFPMISEKEAFEQFCESDMADGRENFTKIVFYDVKILYVTDTKGFYQPVYYFRGKTDGEERNYVVPAIENP